MSAVEHTDVTDTLHENAVRLRLQVLENGIALFTIANADSDLHELMSGKRRIQFGRERLRMACGPDEHDRIARMRQSTQKFALLFGQIFFGRIRRHA